ncbi:MAG TPA: 16S rRNA (guanine(966)-N(2))-methyltransferase RsmD [Candidatus Sulfotelmatobacter sp.]|jgi:16S rRNA (guanine966-N2)-methyltransferase|nr:16S rRNA (guanine(966)-N(2))-methyltransferase RsmD [Candidatus Sulfotelmatobacter sp.]
MRIIAGKHRGRVLLAPAGQTTRPTADRVREALFNILSHGEPELRGARVLDAFAGSGALGFEALSRGAEHVTFLETDPAAYAIIHANAKKMSAGDQVAILRTDATNPPKAKEAFRFLLMDPPYKSGLGKTALPALAAQGWIDGETLVVIEVAAGEPFSSPVKGLAIADERTYGAARLVFLRFSAE